MKIIYEKKSVKKILGEEDTIEIKEVSKATATHKHTCYHDEGRGRPCRRVKI